MAGNPTCIQCKTSDHVLKWKFMGDKDPKAKWDRTSNIVEVAKDTHNPVGCIHCHDPHGTQPRVVRDALIQAIERDGDEQYFCQRGQDRSASHRLPRLPQNRHSWRRPTPE